MYLIAIHVPIYLDGAGRKYLATDWMESLRLLRDSLQDKFGKVVVIAPSCTYDPDNASQSLVHVDEDAEAMELIPSFDITCRCRDYWLRHRAVWKKQLREVVKRAEVVHAGLDDLYRPISYDGYCEGVRQHRTTVFVQDTDISVQVNQLSASRGLVRRGMALGYSKLFERTTRKSVRAASLSLLKGQQLIDRYGSYAKNAKLFHDTSFSLKHVIDPKALETRCQLMQERLATGGPLRLVYCGRLTARKGILDSIDIVEKCRANGTAIELDIIGHGEQLEDIRDHIQALQLSTAVRLLGRMNYGDELFEKLRTYDGLLFTPLAEDTPRMIFDGYAAGLPLIAYDIDYCIERDRCESAAVLLPIKNVSESAGRIATLVANPQALAGLSRAAHTAAVYHSAESWYRRRAEWTFEAADQTARASRVQVRL